MRLDKQTILMWYRCFVPPLHRHLSKIYAKCIYLIFINSGFRLTIFHKTDTVQYKITVQAFIKLHLSMHKHILQFKVGKKQMPTENSNQQYNDKI